MGHFPRYKLTDKQIRGISNIVLHEQGTIEGYFAEASQIANRTDIRGDQYATGANVVKTVTSGWYAKGKSRYNAGTSNEKVIAIVKKVFCDGFRTLPRYIDEHDCMSDIGSVRKNGKNIRGDKSKWTRHDTVIKNHMGSTYIFYDFPGGYKTGVDPFGYTSRAMREKWGDFCYTVDEALHGVPEKQHYTGTYPTLPKRGYYRRNDGKEFLKDATTQIKRIQRLVNWALDANLTEDGIYGEKTFNAVKKLQKKFKLPINGCFGKLCLEKCKAYKK